MMKMWRMAILFALMVSVFAGCRKDDDRINVDSVFVGESAHWKVEYKIQGYIDFIEKDNTLHVDSDSSSDITVEYKGELEQLSSMRTISVDYGDGSNAIEESDGTPTDVKFQWNEYGDVQKVLMASEGKFNSISITWDGENGGTETVELKEE